MMDIGQLGLAVVVGFGFGFATACRLFKGQQDNSQSPQQSKEPPLVWK